MDSGNRIQRLLEKAQEGDREALGAIVEENTDWVNGL